MAIVSKNGKSMKDLDWMLNEAEKLRRKAKTVNDFNNFDDRGLSDYLLNAAMVLEDGFSENTEDTGAN